MGPRSNAVRSISPSTGASGSSGRPAAAASSRSPAANSAPMRGARLRQPAERAFRKAASIACQRSSWRHANGVRPPAGGSGGSGQGTDSTATRAAARAAGTAARRHLDLPQPRVVISATQRILPPRPLAGKRAGAAPVRVSVPRRAASRSRSGRRWRRRRMARGRTSARACAAPRNG